MIIVPTDQRYGAPITTFSTHPEMDKYRFRENGSASKVCGCDAFYIKDYPRIVFLNYLENEDSCNACLNYAVESRVKIEVTTMEFDVEKIDRLRRMVGLH